MLGLGLGLNHLLNNRRKIPYVNDSMALDFDARIAIGNNVNDNNNALTRGYLYDRKGNNGTLYNYGYTSSSGWLSNGLQNDTNDYTKFISTDLNEPFLKILDSAEFTFEVWLNINTASALSGLTNIMGFRAYQDYYGYSMTNEGGKLGLRYHDLTGTWVSKISNLNLTKNIDMHLVVSYKSPNLNFYVNNVKQTMNVSNMVTGGNFAHFQIGGNGWAQIEQIYRIVRIYQRQLTDTEVSKNYNLGTSYAPVKFVKKVQTTPLVSFTSDDNQPQTWDVLLPITSARNIPVTTAVISSQRFLSDAQLLSLQNDYGWEIASHTVTHRGLNTLDATEIETELSQSKQTLEGLGLQVNNIVYPLGQESRTVRNIARKYYRSGAAYYGNPNLLPCGKFRMSRVPLGSGFRTPDGQYPITNTFNDFYKVMVDRAVSEKSWLIFMLHPHTAEFDATQQLYLGQTIDYIQSLNVPIVTYNQGLNILGI